MASYEIELNNTYANQEKDVIIPGNQNNIHILLQTDEAGALFLTVSVNNEQLGQAFMCFPNQPVIPYKYMQKILNGNFIFETSRSNYPVYSDFGNSCKLYFISLDEIENAE